jgi:hypothetical protein
MMIAVVAAGSLAGNDRPSTAVEHYINDLNSTKGEVRCAATKHLFELGSAALVPLQRAGAKIPMGLAPSRLDMVYALIAGLPDSGYRHDSFGVIATDLTREQAEKMASRHSFSIPRETSLPNSNRPTFYAQLAAGHDLQSTMKAILANEPAVENVTFNFEIH